MTRNFTGTWQLIMPSKMLFSMLVCGVCLINSIMWDLGPDVKLGIKLFLFWIKWHAGSMNLQSLMTPKEVAGKHWLSIMNVEEKLVETYQHQSHPSQVTNSSLPLLELFWSIRRANLTMDTKKGCLIWKDADWLCMKKSKKMNLSSYFSRIL